MIGRLMALAAARAACRAPVRHHRQPGPRPAAPAAGTTHPQAAHSAGAHPHGLAENQTARIARVIRAGGDGVS